MKTTVAGDRSLGDKLTVSLIKGGEFRGSNQTGPDERESVFIMRASEPFFQTFLPHETLALMSMKWGGSLC